MFTVKHVKDYDRYENTVETIYSAKRVSRIFKPKDLITPTKEAPPGILLVDVSGEEGFNVHLTETPNDGPGDRVFVMNEQGATVADYYL